MSEYEYIKPTCLNIFEVNIFLFLEFSFTLNFVMLTFLLSDL